MADATTYREIHKKNYRKWASEEHRMQQALEALQLFRVQQPIPMVLSVMRAYREGKLKKKHVESILCAFENFHFVFTAVTSQRSSGGISKMYASCARRLENSGLVRDKIEVLRELRLKLKEKIPSHDEFDLYFGDTIYSKNFTKQRKLVKYILTRIDSHHNDTAAIDYGAMTIEHLAPLSPRANEGLTELNIGQLGNLILVGDSLNRKLANKSFAEKKKLLLKGPRFFVDDVIKSATKWTPTEIKRRTTWMAEVAYKKIWLL